MSSDSSSEDEILQQYISRSGNKGKAPPRGKKRAVKVSSSSKEGSSRAKTPSRKRKRVSYAENSSESEEVEVVNDDIEDSDFSMSDEESKDKRKVGE